MAFCTKCGAQMSDDAIFCTSCGTSVSESQESPQSSNQESPIPPPQNFQQAPPQQEYQQAPPQQEYQQAPPQGGYQQAPPQGGYQQAPPQGGYQQQYQQAPPQGAYQQQYQQPPYQNYADPQWDADNNKVYGILAYFGILVLISILAAPKESKFSRIHANQGLVLFIFEIGGSIVVSIISAILMAVGSGSLTMLGVFGLIVGLLWFAFGVCTLILAIMGIVRAAKGETKPLPIIGGITILK